MKKTIRNGEIEAFVATLSGPDSFIRTLRLPHAARQAVRVNLKTLTDRLRLYQEGRKEILDQAVREGHATQDGDQYTIGPEYRRYYGHELQELADVKNDLDIECFDVDAILQDSNLTLAEEDVLLFFRKGAED